MVREEVERSWGRQVFKEVSGSLHSVLGGSVWRKDSARSSGTCRSLIGKRSVFSVNDPRISRTVGGRYGNISANDVAAVMSLELIGSSHMPA